MMIYTIILNYQKGIEAGIEQSKKEIVISMYHDEVPLETIAKYTNLTINEIKKIIDKFYKSDIF